MREWERSEREEERVVEVVEGGGLAGTTRGGLGAAAGVDWADLGGIVGNDVMYM